MNKEICLLRSNKQTLYLIKSEDKYKNIKNGESILPLPEDIRNKEGEDSSDAIYNYAQKLKRKTYSKKLNYQIENLIFLTGAGSSFNIGSNNRKGMLMSGLWDAAVNILKGEQNMNLFCQKIKYKDKDEHGYIKNLEKVLSLAERAKEYIQEDLFNIDNEPWNICKVIYEIKKMIKENCDLRIESSNEFTHEIFLNKITKRKSSLPRVKLFTLNYDTLFEQAARKGNYTVIDGFSFSIPRIFSGRYFDYDVVIRDKSRIKNEDNFVPRVFHLYKPHGSVDWKRQGNAILQDDASKIDVNDSLMIFPQEDKYELSYEQPFFEMMTRFQAALRLQNTTLVTIGFSFGDKHILSMIQEALEQNPSFQLIIINYNKDGITQNDTFFTEAGERGNITIVNEKFQDFVRACPDVKIYDQTDEYRLIKIANNETL